MFLLVMSGGGKEMKNKQIGVITPLLFENNLLITLSKDWINVFEQLPTFKVQVDSNKRLNLTSQEQIKKVKGEKI